MASIVPIERIRHEVLAEIHAGRDADAAVAAVAARHCLAEEAVRYALEVEEEA